MSKYQLSHYEGRGNVATLQENVTRSYCKMSDEETTKFDVDPDEVFKEHSSNWYDVSKSFWENQEASDSGMLAGYIRVSGADIYNSRELIEKYQKKHKLGKKRAADCGAGVGRVTYFCLSEYFEETDLIDPVEKFLDVAVEKLEGYKTRKINLGIQDWHPDTKYDCIWCQWSIMYLTDTDTVAFLQRAKAALNKNGLIFIKDNISSRDLSAPKNSCIVDFQDHGVSRSYSHYLELFKTAGLTLVESEKQDNYPENLLPLYTFVLK
jgi:protein N-terminal methyltransferase